MARNDGVDRTTVRNQPRTENNIADAEAHNERQKTCYRNEDIVPERSHMNIHFKTPSGSYQEMFRQMEQDGTISTRGLKQDAIHYGELVFDVNSAYFHNHGGYEFAQAFYAEAYRVAVDIIGGEQYILSAVMHADERNQGMSKALGYDVWHYHLHVVYVPVVEKQILWPKRCKDPALVGTVKETVMQISHSKEYVDVASQDWDTKAGTMLSGGDTSDLFMVKQNINIMNWAQQGFAEPLTDYIAKDNYDLSGFVGMEPNYALDGTQYALPFRSDFWVLFYNKTLFDAAGVAYPTNDMTWEEYAALAKEMTGKGNCKYGCHYHTWLSAIVNFAVDDGKFTLLGGKYDEMKYFYDLALSLEDADACRKYTELTAAGLHYSGAFQTGDTAMMPMGYWYVATLINNIKNGLCDFEWGITALPHKEDVQAGSSFGNLTGIMINKKSEHKDLAWEYVSWLCGPEGAKVTAGCGNRPAWVSEEVAEVLASVDGFPKDENSKAALLPSMVSIEIGVSDKLAEIQTILNEEHTMIMTREISVDEGIEEMNERVAELYE